MTAVYRDADGYTHTNRYAQDNILTKALSCPPQERASLYPQCTAISRSTLFLKVIIMYCSLYCGSIKAKTASVLFQTLAVVLRWWRRRESNPCPEGR